MKKGGEGLVIFQHWLSNEVLTSTELAHIKWVSQCFSRLTLSTAAMANQDLKDVINSNSE